MNTFADLIVFMKHFILTAAIASLAAVSCARISMETENLQHMTFSASFIQDDGTRATLDVPSVRWASGDEIAVFDGNAVRKFTLKEGDGETSATFEGEAAASDRYMAVYPYSNRISVDGNGNISGLSIPRVQNAVLNGVNPKYIILAAASENGEKSFAFKNAVSYIKMTPEFDCNKIVFETDREGGICGDIAVSTSAENVTAEIVSGTGSGSIILNGPVESGGTYYIAAVPCTSNGFAAIFDSAEDNLLYIRKTGKNTELIRSHVLNLGSFHIDSTPWSEKGTNLYEHEVPWEDRAYYKGYRIYDWRDLKRFAACVEARGSNGYTRAYLMNDIDFGGRTLEPIEFSNAVSVIIDGCGHRIFNYDQGYKDADDSRYAGLIYYDDIVSFTFYDLTLNPRTFNVQYGKNIYGGGFIAKGGKGKQCTSVRFGNCRFMGDIQVKCTGNALACAGGFASVIHTELYAFDSVVEQGSVTAWSMEDLAYAGGIAGYCDPDRYDGVIDLSNNKLQLGRCRNKAYILAEGQDDSGTTPLSKTYDGVCAGGMIGRVTDNLHTDAIISLNSCVNEAEVKAWATDNDYAYAGGMIGCHNSDGYLNAQGEKNPLVSNCLNKGVVTAWSNDSGSRAAGMTGACYDNDTRFRNCANIGALVANGGEKAHISGTHGSYEDSSSLKCRWNDNSHFGIYLMQDTDGYTATLTSDLMNFGRPSNASSWSGENGSLDLDF